MMEQSVHVHCFQLSPGFHELSQLSTILAYNTLVPSESACTASWNDQDFYARSAMIRCDADELV